MNRELVVCDDVDYEVGAELDVVFWLACFTALTCVFVDVLRVYPIHIWSVHWFIVPPSSPTFLLSTSNVILHRYPRLRHLGPVPPPQQAEIYHSRPADDVDSDSTKSFHRTGSYHERSHT